MIFLLQTNNQLPLVTNEGELGHPKASEAGKVKLTGTDKTTIIAASTTLLSDTKHYATMAEANNPYGDGEASEISGTNVGELVLFIFVKLYTVNKYKLLSIDICFLTKLIHIFFLNSQKKTVILWLKTQIKQNILFISYMFCFCLICCFISNFFMACCYFLYGTDEHRRV